MQCPINSFKKSFKNRCSKIDINFTKINAHHFWDAIMKNFLVTTTKMTSTKVRIRVFFLSCLFICFLHPSVTILPELDCRNCSKDICGIVFPQIPPCYKYSSLSLPFKREKCLANEIFPRSISRSRFSSSSSGREDQESSL